MSVVGRSITGSRYKFVLLVSRFRPPLSHNMSFRYRWRSTAVVNVIYRYLRVIAVVKRRRRWPGRLDGRPRSMGQGGSRREFVNRPRNPNGGGLTCAAVAYITSGFSYYMISDDTSVYCRWRMTIIVVFPRFLFSPRPCRLTRCYAQYIIYLYYRYNI